MWLNQYGELRHLMHDLSESVGAKYLILLFLFSVEVSSMIGTIWEAMRDGMTWSSTSFFLLAYVANATVVLLSTFSAAYIPVVCGHYIGPKLAMLVAVQDEVPKFGALSQAFLLAPIRLHVGNFELSPEYSSALMFWFVGLMLACAGLVSPGSE